LTQETKAQQDSLKAKYKDLYGFNKTSELKINSHLSVRSLQKKGLGDCVLFVGCFMPSKRHFSEFWSSGLVFLAFQDPPAKNFQSIPISPKPNSIFLISFRA